MVHRYSNDIKDLAISMSLQGLRDSEIRELTGISVRSLKRFQQTHRETGGVPSPPPINNGRPRTLTAIQVKFLRDSVDRQPDVSLVELQAELREACGTEVSLSTATARVRVTSSANPLPVLLPARSTRPAVYKLALP
ncbi:hypothetical protein EDB85DRAFT_2151882 [Lactarius pseudohatsudake]|nr:hypothetical protein EDB85DRAFT_2151882 [Lactarius pseudohatsudake]